MKKVIVFRNATLFSGKGVIQEPFIEIENGKIIEIGEVKTRHCTGSEEVIENKARITIVPGFIDLHIHGAENADVMDGTVKSIETLQKALLKEGTTAFLPTTITQSNEEKLQALVNIKDYMNNKSSSGAEILGVHLEGPFISKKRAGAQPSQHICAADLNLFKKFQDASGNSIKLVTMAPEESGFQLIEYLRDNGIIPSIGHSDASYVQVLKAIESGICHATHLFNGMRGMHHRDIGVVGAALLHKELKAEMIVDGIHISPPMVKLAYQNKGPEGIILITDSMRAKGLKGGIYQLGGQDVFVKENRAELSNGTLAGSILKMNEAIRNMISFSGCTFQEAIQMATFNPAKQLGVSDRKGSLGVGKDADFVVLNDRYEVLQTYTFGNKVYG